jgi:hypothetical protein
MGREQQPSEKFALVVRVLSGLMGLSLGFIAGQVWASPFKSVRREIPAGAAGSLQGMPPAGAPLPERIAAAARMDEDALTGVLAAVQEEWMGRSGNAGNGAPQTMLQLRMIFSRWTDLNGVGALKAALELQDHALGDMALEAVMAEWGLRDALAASQSLSRIPRASAQRRAALALVRSGVKRNPPDGFAIASRTPFLPPVILRGAAGAEWMRRDPLHALRYLYEEPGITGAVPSGAALGQWLLEDPSAWLTWYRAEKNAKYLPLVRIFPQWISAGRLTRLAAGLTREFENLDAGLAWLYSVSGAYGLPLVVMLSSPDRGLAAEMQYWESSRPGLAGPGSVRGWLPRLRHARILGEILPRLTAMDPGFALKALAGMAAEDDAARLAPAVASQWIEQAPATASAQIFASDLTHPVTKAAASTAVDELISSNPLQALDSLARLPLEKSDISAHRAAAFKQLALSKPAEMLAWLTEHADVSAPDESVTTAVKNLAAMDAAKAQTWVQQSAPPVQRPVLAGIVFEVQLRSDRESALAFLAAHAPGPGRDAILASLAAADIALSRRDSNFAGNLLPDCFALTLQIGNDALRIETLRNLITAMKETGVPPAASLAHPSLRPADRATLTR